MTTIRLRDRDFSYDLSGGGAATPFVWGHGLTSSRASEDRMPLIDCSRLATGRQVLRYDARGHGESGDLMRPEEGAWSELALDQIALIDELGLDKVALGGASMGTATALHTALRLGDRIERLILTIPPTAWASRAEQIGLYEQMAQAVETQGVAPLVYGAKTMPPPDPFIGDAEYVARRVEGLEAADTVRLAAMFRGAGHADLPVEDALPALLMPALILAWTGDTGHPVSTAERLGELLPNSQVVLASTRAELDTWTQRCADFLDS
ncbi:MAG: 3-oxoadipate enol-lactonase [Ilumatobacter sp.]|jgi:3-oxoadipate enol-lactonase